MARPKTPTAVLELNGAFRKNPQRARARADEPKPAYGIGDPPKRFMSETSPTAIQHREIWHEIVERMPWLTSADWLALESLVELTAKMRRGTITCGERAQMHKVNSELGGTGTGRAGRSAPKNEEKDASPWAKLAGAKAG